MFKTWDQIERPRDPLSIYQSDFARPIDPTNEGFTTVAQSAKQAEIAERSVIGAAFRQDNTVVSMSSRMDLGLDNADDGTFDPIAYARENNLQGFERSFFGVLNRQRADAVRLQIEMERRDKETLDAAGWVGTFAQIAAGVVDAPSLIPGAVLYRNARGGYSVARSVLMGGASTGAIQAGTEVLLQATQETRTAGESAVNIGAAVVLGSLMGGGVAALLSRSERAVAERALAAHVDAVEGRTPQGGRGRGGGLGAELAEDARLDPVDVARSRGELGVAGGAASAVVGATSFLNPMLRGTQRAVASARQFSASLFEGTIYRNMHEVGETTGISVEAAARTRVMSTQAQAMRAAEDAYEEMWRGNSDFVEAYGTKYWGRMSRDDFYADVGRAMRNNDEGSNEFVTRAAREYRKLFDTFTNDALELGLLKSGDLDVKTAASYFSRVYNRDRLLADEAGFLELIGKHTAERMKVAYDEDLAKITTERSRFKQRLADLETEGPTRARLVEDLTKRGEALDKSYEDMAELIDELSEGVGALRRTASLPAGPEREAQRELIRGRVKDAKSKGGTRLDEYLTERAELRARMQNLRERNPDAQAARYDKVVERIEATEEAAVNSLMTFSRRAKNLVNSSDGVQARAEKALELVTKQVERFGNETKALEQRATDLRASLAKNEARAAELKAQYVDEMDPTGAFTRAAERAASEGADDPIKAGTAEADRVTKQIKDAKAVLTRIDNQVLRLNSYSERLRKGAEKIEKLTDKLATRADELADAPALKAQIDELLKEAAGITASVNTRRGEALARLKERQAKLSPEARAARSAEQRAAYDAVLEGHDRRFENRWGARLAIDLETKAKYDFEGAGRSTAQEVFNKITGRDAQADDVPSFLTRITAGPLKERTFMVEDSLLAGKGWLVDDVRQVASRYSRAMAGEVELTRRFGRADMREQIAALQADYTSARVAVAEAKTVEDVNAILGREAGRLKGSLEKVKFEATEFLNLDQTGAITDLKTGRDLIRGTHAVSGQFGAASNFGAITRSIMALNYIRVMGGVVLSSFSDLFRTPMVHGLGPFLNTLPDQMAQAFGKGSAGLKMSIEEAKLAGLVSERVTQSIMAANGDFADPFIGKVGAVERLLQRGTSVASRWNLINSWTDGMQSIAAVVSQHRVIEAALGNAGKDGSFVIGDGTRMLRMLGVSAGVERDIATFFKAHGDTVDGVKVANTERWISAANETGDAKMIARAERAVREYRAAINTDVNSIVSRRGVGDAPLFANTPLGKLLTQFSGYAMGAHSRVMVRGMQEDQGRFVGGLVAMTMLGAASSYLSAFRGGQERFDKHVRDMQQNPAKLIGEGLDRSGLFPLFFDIANRTERFGGAMGSEYRLNPIKSTIAAGGRALGAQGDLTSTTTRGSDTGAAMGALFGPTVGMIDSVLSAGRAAADTAAGRPVPKRELNQALAVVPFSSYYGMREMLQVVTGNSPYPQLRP